MEYYAIYLPYKEPELSIKSYYNDKEEALKVLKSHKEARFKAFRTSEEAVCFYLQGPSESVPQVVPPKSPTSTSPKLKLEKTPFKVPKSQELVAFRKNIEKNELDMVRNIIQLNPRYLVSSGDMPTILKEGPRYNALHVAAIEGNTDMCRMILSTIENPQFIEFLHGQRNPSTDEVSAILLDLYLNMPEKCRSETPLHFAAKYGSVGVVEVLISYPQCKMTKNSDGHFPKDIICSRAKDKNTPEIRNAIQDLLQGRYFVPVLRAVDNSTTPLVGEPFTLSNPPNLEAKDKFSPKLEIKAYAGPMDKEKAQVFCKRWKTPPRLIPSPKFLSPVKSHSSSKIPISIPFGGSGATSPLSSTPIARKTGRRTLFPNRSFEQAMEQVEQENINSINNNYEIDIVKEDVDLEALEEQRQQDEKNGNSLAGVNSLASFRMRMSPVKKSSDSPNIMFRKYRERLQNSFSTIYDDDDTPDLNEIRDQVKSEIDLEALEEQRQQDEENGKNLTGLKSITGKNHSDSPNLMFRKYRERLQNSFSEIYDDDDDTSGLNKIRDQVGEPNAVAAENKSTFNLETSFSYFCDENNSIYEGNNIMDSPSFKERKLRLTDTEKGLEIIGRNLAEDQKVGWNEYWEFLGAFADLRSHDGLKLFDNYLRKRHTDASNESSPNEVEIPTASQLPISLKHRFLAAESKTNDSLGSICDALEGLNLSTKAAQSSFKYRTNRIGHTHQSIGTEPICSKIINPYLCLHNSLQVYAKRFIKNLDDSSTSMTMDFASFFQQAVVDSVRKLNTLVDNYRKDAAFKAIDFSKVHSRYAQLIVTNIEQQQEKETVQGVIHRLKVLLDKSREVKSARKYPDLQESLICLQNFLDFYIHRKSDLMKDYSNELQTEASCSKIWCEDPLLHCCNCRIEGGYAKKGSLERLNKRREHRQKAASNGRQVTSSGRLDAFPTLGADVSSIRSMTTSTGISVSGSNFEVYRSRPAIGQLSDDEDDEYFSCSDSDEDDPNLSYETPPSSPSFFSQSSSETAFDVSKATSDEVIVSDEKDEDQFLDSNGDLVNSDEELEDDADDERSSESDCKQYKNFIEGTEPSKQDVDVLNVIERREIDPSKYPYVHEWRKIMLKLPVEERDRLSLKASKPRWRVNTSFAYSDGSVISTVPPCSRSVPNTPVNSISSVHRVDSTSGCNNSLTSLNGRLALMNISDLHSSTSQGLQLTPSL